MNNEEKIQILLRRREIKRRKLKQVISLVRTVIITAALFAIGVFLAGRFL